MIVQPEAFGRNLKRILKEKHMSQAKLGEALDIGQLSVNRWCNGLHLPALDTFSMITKILDVSADELLEGMIK